MSSKDTSIPNTTITFNRDEIENKVGNIYKAIVIMGKRAEQISSEFKDELTKKLDDFSNHSDGLDEVFENREQIEVSRYYEKLPKATLIAINELLENDIYYRYPEENN